MKDELKFRKMMNLLGEIYRGKKLNEIVSLEQSEIPDLLDHLIDEEYVLSQRSNPHGIIKDQGRGWTTPIITPKGKEKLIEIGSIKLTK